VEYIKLNNGVVDKYPYPIHQLKMDNPNVSFPAIPPVDLLSEWGVFPVTVAQIPAYDPLLQVIRKDAPQNVNGAWLVPWVVEQIPQDAAERNIRDERNQMLSESDWTQVADAPVDKAAWATYRQELRDITDQAGFPYNVVWPIPPA
jgi:hypothetical protein